MEALSSGATVFEVVAPGFEVSKHRFNRKPFSVTIKGSFDVSEIGQQIPNLIGFRLAIHSLPAGDEIESTKPLLLSHLHLYFKAGNAWKLE